jgi:hypothetical protein
MTPTPAAIRAKAWRSKFKEHIAPVMHARAHAVAEIATRVRAESISAAEVARVLARAARTVADIELTGHPAIRARKLGALIDWLSQEDTQEILARAKQIPQPLGRPRKPVVQLSAPAARLSVTPEAILAFEAASADVREGAT